MHSENVLEIQPSGFAARVILVRNEDHGHNKVDPHGPSGPNVMSAPLPGLQEDEFGAKVPGNTPGTPRLLPSCGTVAVPTA